MAEKNGDMLERLKNKEKLKCPKCHTGDIVPYNAPPDKAHLFVCSNSKCNWNLHCDPVINIE